MTGLWADLMTMGVPIAEKLVRTVAVYAFLVIGLRIFGKRELGQLNPLDFIVLLLLANTVQNAIIGSDNSLAGGLLGAAALFVMNDLLVRYGHRRPRFRRLLEGHAELVIHDGRINHHALDRNVITKDEILAAARAQGIQDLHEVDSARLEVSGAMSFTRREPGTTERFHVEVLSRLAAIEKRLAAATLAFLLVAPAWHAARAQARPSTDVWVVSMHQMGSMIHFGEPVNATKRTGYDNQPSFMPDGNAVLYTVIDDGGQADAWQFALPAGKPARMTDTKESEYSPTVMPDGRQFSVIRVEADSAQRLWRFPLDQSGPPALVLEGAKPVGYHAWAGDHTLVLFVLGSPATLQLADDRTGTAEIVARDIGRALVRVPGRDAVTFMQQVPDSAPWIAELDVRTKTTRRLVQPPRGADYHAWTPDGALIVASGSNLFRHIDGRWDQVADFTRWGVRGISRLAVSPKGDWLAFVAEDQPAR